MQTKIEKAKYCQQWLLRNKERHSQTNKAWAKRNQEKHLAIQRASYHRNKHKNRARRLARATKWYYANRDQILPIKVAQYRQQITELRHQIFQHYGRCCACCGLRDERFLTIDHVFFGKGNKLPKSERRTETRKMMRHIIEEKFPDSYQLLCMNCNWVKGCRGKCFHETDREELIGTGICSGKTPGIPQTT